MDASLGAYAKGCLPVLIASDSTLLWLLAFLKPGCPAALDPSVMFLLSYLFLLLWPEDCNVYEERAFPVGSWSMIDGFLVKITP